MLGLSRILFVKSFLKLSSSRIALSLSVLKLRLSLVQSRLEFGIHVAVVVIETLRVGRCVAEALVLVDNGLVICKLTGPSAVLVVLLMGKIGEMGGDGKRMRGENVSWRETNKPKRGREKNIMNEKRVLTVVGKKTWPW